jgi:hypothetical protein
MTLRTLPLDYDLVIYSGATLRREFRWRPEGGTAQDFTGWSARLLIGPFHGIAIHELSTANGHIDMTADGIIRLTMPAAQTEVLDLDADLAYQLDLTQPDGFVLRFLRGRVSIVQDVEPAP